MLASIESNWGRGRYVIRFSGVHRIGFHLIFLHAARAIDPDDRCCGFDVKSCLSVIVAILMLAVGVVAVILTQGSVF